MSDDYLGELVDYKGVKITRGRALFNECLPDDYPIVDCEITKKKLNKIIDDIVLKYSPKIAIETLDKIKKLGFTLSSAEGFTLSLDDIYDAELKDYAKKLYTGDYERDQEKIKKDKFLIKKLKEFPFAIYIESGARGSWDQAKQLVFARGYVADSRNRIRPQPIKSNLVNGLTPTDFFASCYGSRKGLLDTALSTGDTGYLTRQLIYSTSNIELGDIEDCGTNDCINMEIKDESDVKSILWRYYINEDGKRTLVKLDDMSKLLGKKLKVRSPIYCTEKKVCKTCYGKLSNILHSSQIGIIATQAIGEKATQLVLRTFHISGSVSSGKGGKNEDIISGMGIIKKVFHSPKRLEKVEGTGRGTIDTPEELLNLIRMIFGGYGGILSVHFEVIISAMMWADDKKWRLLKDRDLYVPEYVSILQIPSKTSWLMGCAFSNLKQKLIDGIIDEDQDESSSITDLFRF